jgi:hypothetical protein
VLNNEEPDERSVSPTAKAPSLGQESREGHEYLKGLHRMRVRGDGSCWIYALLTGIGLCEHSVSSHAHDHKAHLPDPTAMDRQLDKGIRQRMHNSIYNSEGNHHFDDEVLKTPDYGLLDENGELKNGAESEQFFGSYGGHKEFCALAEMFTVNIVLWSEDYEDARDDRCNYSRIDVKTQYHDLDRNLGFLAWSKTLVDHYEAYVDDHEYSQPQWLLDMQKEYVSKKCQGRGFLEKFRRWLSFGFSMMELSGIWFWI